MADDDLTKAAPPEFVGFTPRECGEHRTVGPHRAWCHDDTEWCYPNMPCHGCMPAPAPTVDRGALAALIDGEIREVERAWRAKETEDSRSNGEIAADALISRGEKHHPGQRDGGEQHGTRR